jgi:hypothetical protein
MIRFRQREHPSEPTDGDRSGGYLYESLERGRTHLSPNLEKGHSLIRENRINGAFAIGSDDLDAMIQVVPQRVAYVGPVRVRIRPQRRFGQHFIGDLDLYLFVDLMYESVVGHGFNSIYPPFHSFGTLDAVLSHFVALDSAPERLAGPLTGDDPPETFDFDMWTSDREHGDNLRYIATFAYFVFD